MYRSMYRGALANIPLAVSAVTYGGVLGVLSGQKGVSWAEREHPMTMASFDDAESLFSGNSFAFGLFLISIKK